MTVPEIGDTVLIDAVAFGSLDVIGMTGTVENARADYFEIKVEFVKGQHVIVPATEIRPA